MEHIYYELKKKNTSKPNPNKQKHTNKNKPHTQHFVKLFEVLKGPVKPLSSLGDKITISQQLTNKKTHEGWTK